MAIITFCLVLASCAVKVEPKDLTGRWRMTDETIRLLGLDFRPSFSLNSDGSLIADNLPASAFSDYGSWQRLYNGTGVWTVPPVRRTEGFARVVLNFQKSGPDEPTGLTLQVDKDSDGFYVFAWLNEEGGERVEFRRQFH
jgi:hypothetical protein